MYQADDDARTVFYNKTEATMDLELEQGFESGSWVYLAERDRVLRVRDSDGDGRGDDGHHTRDEIGADAVTRIERPADRVRLQQGRAEKAIDRDADGEQDSQ